jgi:hypothetical protein
VLVGPGGVEYRSAPGHFGPAVERAIYGQVVDAERLGGLAARKLPPDTKRVVLVPWDYGADCQPTPWARSARWVEPGDHGFFTGVLREREHWAGGLPTFDVFTPSIAPYPVRGGWALRGTRPHPDSILTAEQYFELSNLLPTYESIRRLHTEALAPLLNWARTHPELTRRYPASDIIRRNLSAGEGARIRSIVPPIVGTYRVEAMLTDEKGRPDGAPRIFYLRTRPTADHGFAPIRGPDPLATLSAISYRGYYIYLAGAASADALPANERVRQIEREGWLAVLAEPEVERGGREVWRGRVELEIVGRQFPADSAMRRFVRDAERADAVLAEEEWDWPTPARFIRSPGGRIEVAQTVRLKDGRTLTLKGERISQTIVQAPE